MRERLSRSAPKLAVCVLALVLGACGTLTVQEEKQLGAQYQAQLRKELTFVRDPVTVSYVRKFGESLAKAARPSPFEFRFYVIENEELNAFAVPGGAMYVNTGLIQAVKNSAELAGVLSHEMGHVTARHVAKNAKRGRNTGFVANVFYFVIAVLTGNPYLANAGGIASSVAGTAYMSSYTRDAEREADALAVETMVHAGWNPEGMVTMFETLDKETGGGGGGPQFLSSHPANDERIANVQRDILKYPGSDKLKWDDGKLPIIQERLKLIVGTDSDRPADDEEPDEDDEE